jgi:hypothetical protein
MGYTQTRPCFNDLVEFRYIVLQIESKLDLMMDEDKSADCSDYLSSIYLKTDELHKKAHYVLLAESEREDEAPCLLWADSKPDFRVAGELATYLKSINRYIAAVSDGADTVQRVMELWVEIDVFFEKVKKVCLPSCD